MYAKLFTSIYQGTLRGNSHGLLVFTNLLAHCDKAGEVDIHPRAIAEEVGLTVEQVKAALTVLESPDDESRSPEEQGRRITRLDAHRAWGWRVVNYVKYRAIRSEDDRREQNRASQERWRKAHSKQSKPPSAAISRDKPQSAHTEAEAEADTEAKAIEQTPRKRGRVSVIGLGVDELVCLGVERQHAQDWIASRKAKRLPLTQTALDETKAEAERAGVGLPEAIRIAAANGWGGFKAAWVQAPLAKPRKSDALMAGNIAAAQRFLEGHES